MSESTIPTENPEAETEAEKPDTEKPDTETLDTEKPEKKTKKPPRTPFLDANMKVSHKNLEYVTNILFQNALPYMRKAKGIKKQTCKILAHNLLAFPKVLFSSDNSNRQAYYSYNIQCLRYSHLVKGVIEPNVKAGFLVLSKGNKLANRIGFVRLKHKKLRTNGLEDMKIYYDNPVIMNSKEDKKLIDREYLADKKLQKQMRAINEMYSNHYFSMNVTAYDQGLKKQSSSLRRYLFEKVIKQNEVKLNCLLRRVFTNGKDRGGRLYGDFQSFKSDYRQFIKIDGQDTVELDFKGLHPTMLYHQKGLDIPDDVYMVIYRDEKYRPLLKKALLYIINAKDYPAARNSLQSDINRYRVACPMKYEEIKRREPNPDKTAKRKKIDVYETIYRKLTAAEILEKVIKKHPAIADDFYSDSGAKLQYIDSQIALEIIEHFRAKDIPVLPIHDSFIVAKQHKDELRQVMQESYRKIMNGKTIEIEEKKPKQVQLMAAA